MQGPGFEHLTPPKKKQNHENSNPRFYDIDSIYLTFTFFRGTFKHLIFLVKYR